VYACLGRDVGGVFVPISNPGVCECVFGEAYEKGICTCVGWKGMDSSKYPKSKRTTTQLKIASKGPDRVGSAGLLNLFVHLGNLETVYTYSAPLLLFAFENDQELPLPPATRQ